MKYEFDLSFFRFGVGWMADALNQPARPRLAARLAKDFERARRTWEAASSSERDAFTEWLWKDANEPD